MPQNHGAALDISELDISIVQPDDCFIMVVNHGNKEDEKKPTDIFWHDMLEFAENNNSERRIITSTGIWNADQACPRVPESVIMTASPKATLVDLLDEYGDDYSYIDVTGDDVIRLYWNQHPLANPLQHCRM